MNYYQYVGYEFSKNQLANLPCTNNVILKLLNQITSFQIGKNMNPSNQVFIQFDPNDEPIEFLLLEQPLEMIRANIVTDQQVRETIEKGFQHPNETFTRVDQYGEHRLLLYITIEIDVVLRYIKKIELRIE